MDRRTFSKSVLAAALASAGLCSFPALGREDTVRIGILHSLSGTMAISESSLKDAVLMAVGYINLEGGVLGRYVDPVVLDPASNWDLFETKAERLIDEYDVAAIFGCWTSTSRKRVLPVVERKNSLLFYPVQYEGQEQSPNIFYTGATPNQQAIPAINYFIHTLGYKKFVLLGTDYIYPRTTNRILRAFLNDRGISNEAILERYTPFSHRDYRGLLKEIQAFADNEDTVIVSTVNGDSNTFLYQQRFEIGLEVDRLPILAFSVGEVEIQALDSRHARGHYAAWNYFMSVDSQQNHDFLADWRLFARNRSSGNSGDIILNDPIEATYIGIQLWKQAVEQAGSFETNEVRRALSGQTYLAPSGYQVAMDSDNHHLHKPFMLGRINGNRQFEVIWKSEKNIAPEPWISFISEPGNKA